MDVFVCAMLEEFTIVLNTDTVESVRAVAESVVVVV